jgi:hypothetical protein
VTSQGPLDPSAFASSAPDPSAAAGALATLGHSIDTYQRVWQDPTHANEVQDLLVRFPSAAAAQIFERSALHSLQSGEIVSSVTLRSVPGAHRITYFGSTTQPGVGEAVAMRAGAYVDLLSFFSAAAGNARPIAPADAERVARAQHAAMAAAPGGSDTPKRRGVTAGSLVWAALAVAVLAAAVATPLALRRHRARQALRTPT